MNRRIKEIIKNPLQIFFTLGHWGFLKWMPDETFVKIGYRIRMKKKLNLEDPKTYNEKLQWMKLYNHDPEYTVMADKYGVRSLVKERIGEDFLIPLLGAWEKFDDIDFDSLPNQFVLKCTHDSGGLIICRDKSKLDMKAARKKLSRCLRQNYYGSGREWQYKNIPPRIIAEQYMVDESGTQLKDYKFFCFDGEVKAMFVASDRTTETKFDFYDKDFNRMPVMQHYKNSDKPIDKPANYEEMIKIAEILSKGYPHVRVDLYNINGKIYFGEYTFFHFTGMERFEPDSYDDLFGSWIDLGKIKK